MQQRHNHKRGFNLIEAAIVLGVVGLVVGGIWVAAANMYENYKTNKTVEGIFSTSRNIQNLISIRDSEAIGHSVVITSALKDAGVFPKNWVDGDTVKSNFGGNIIVYNRIASGGNRFLILFDGISPKICVNMLFRVSAIGKKANLGWTNNKQAPGLGYVVVYPGGISSSIRSLDTSTLPVSMNVARTACSDQSNNAVGFGFGYTRTN